jgi:cation/acetate symporter
MLKVPKAPDDQPRPRHGASLGAFAVVAGAACLLLAGLQRFGLATEATNAGYLLIGICVALALALMARGVPTKAGPAMQGLGVASDSIGAAFFLGLSGAVFAWGQDGLAFGLGLGGGYVLAQLVVAARLPRWDAASVPDFFAVRYGRFARTLAAVVIAISMAVLVMAQLTAAGIVTARLLDLAFGTGVAVSAIALYLCFVLKGRSGAGFGSSILFPLMLLAFLGPAVILSMQWYGLPVPQIAYSKALWQVQGLEETLLEQELADPAFMKPLLGSFLSLTTTNVLGIILAIATGLACLPHVLSRYFMQTDTPAARWSAVWALGFAAVLISTAPVLGIYAKHALFSLIGAKTQLSALPEWIFTYGKLGFVEVCARAATDVATVTAACAALPDAPTVLRLQDLAIEPDIVALATPEITGLGNAMLGILGAAALAAALVTSDDALRAIIGSSGRADGTRPARSDTIAAAVVVAVVAAAAMTRPAGMLSLATWAFSLAAAGLFPALAAGLWWRRANGYGACAAMILGFGFCLFYLVATRYFAVPFFEASQPLSGAGMMARETFNELREAWSTAGGGKAGADAWAALDLHAQTIANWWGIKPMAVVLLALPAGFVSIIAVSLVTRATAIERMA